MKLLSIKAHGFKSFADKIEIIVGDGITGIVGPNGSGKSNVVDAVKWVLGESSLKELRGGDTGTDIIFNGSNIITIIIFCSQQIMIQIIRKGHIYPVIITRITTR